MVEYVESYIGAEATKKRMTNSLQVFYQLSKLIKSMYIEDHVNSETMRERMERISNNNPDAFSHADLSEPR